MSNQFGAWIGRSVTLRDVLRIEPARFFEATLGRQPSIKQGDALPPLWHWLYFLEAKPSGELGRDGHPRKGDFLPPVELPRRMWAGGRFNFASSLRMGNEVQRLSTIKSVAEKSGRSGSLCFVTVKHEIFQDEQLCVTEEHDIVYREEPSDNPLHRGVKEVAERPVVSETVVPSEVMLFRYSALTFNGHRIHYDVDYARSVEGYEGLVFHGPLTATLLVDLGIRVSGRVPRSFAFRGQAPLAGMMPFQIEVGKQDDDRLKLWARRWDGAEAMVAEMTF